MIANLVQKATLPKKVLYPLQQATLNLQRQPIKCSSSDTTTNDNKQLKQQPTNNKPAPFKRTTSITQAPVGGHDLDIKPSRALLDPDMVEWLDERQVRISRPSKNVMQSGTVATHTWKIEFNSEKRWENWLMGWTSSADPMSNLSLNFPTKEAAVDYCERNKLSWFVEDQPERQVIDMFYAVFLPLTYILPDDDMLQLEDLIFTDIKDASAALKKYKGSRMRTFENKDRALECMLYPEKLDESLVEEACNDLTASLSRLSIDQQEKKPSATTNKVEETTSEFPSVKPDMLNKLRKKIESGDYEEVEQLIWSNPRCLVTVCDSATYLMAGPKYNACHIAARSNKPDITALILDTISNFSFIKKLYPNEPDVNVQDRINHLLDSYLNTAEPRQGNTPLHFACKLGHYRVVRVLLTFEGCDLNLKDSQGKTAEEGICLQVAGGISSIAREGGDGNSVVEEEAEEVKRRREELATIRKKMKELFKSQLHSPLHRDQLKKRLLLAKRRNRAAAAANGVGGDSDISFSDMDDSLTSIFTDSPRPAAGNKEREK